ncbi:MAG: RimK family alpha-L-glutamate ligase [Halanaerobiaceae bacterium]|nr:RimK family alpha-L-glutamate ligase [Halanaerobiaceae bacterium]
MRGWIIYKVKESELTEEHYETRRFLEEAEKAGIEISVYRPEQIDIIVTSEGRQSIFVDDKEAALPDFVLPRMGAGTSYFALAVIRHLERQGVFSVNSSVSIETVRDKLYTHQILAESKLPVPKTMLLKFPVDYEHIKKHMGFPMIIKTLSGSLGRGVFLAENMTMFENIARIVEIANPNMNIILQEMIMTSYGKDLRIFVVGGRVVGSMLREARDSDYRANYSAGGRVSYFELTEEIEWLALEATRILGLDVAGVDLLFHKEGFMVCEVNSSPMFRGMESCNDVNIPQEIYKYIKFRLNKPGDK